MDGSACPITYAGNRVAFFGGSFDPPHAGHLAVAHAARKALALDTVLFAPVGAQPLKPLGSTAPFADRIAMTGLAIAGEEGFALSAEDTPTDVGSPNYTIDTLLHLHKRLATGAVLFCLMGADSFRNLHRWHRAAEIPFAASLVVASRPGEPLGDLAEMMPEGVRLEHDGAEPDGLGAGVAEQTLKTYTVRNDLGGRAPFYVMPGVHMDISASQIREHLRKAQPNRSETAPLIDPAVAAYLEACALYRAG